MVLIKSLTRRGVYYHMTSFTGDSMSDIKGVMSVDVIKKLDVKFILRNHHSFQVTSHEDEIKMNEDKGSTADHTASSVAQRRSSRRSSSGTSPINKKRSKHSTHGIESRESVDAPNQYKSFTNPWHKVFFNLAESFQNIEETDWPLNDFLLFPTHRFMKYTDDKQKTVKESKRYVPDMLNLCGLNINDLYGDCVLNGVAFSTVITKKKQKKNLVNALNYFGLFDSFNNETNHRQIEDYAHCFLINYNINNRGHGNLCPPEDNETWPPTWFKNAIAVYQSSETDFISPSPIQRYQSIPEDDCNFDCGAKGRLEALSTMHSADVRNSATNAETEVAKDKDSVVTAKLQSPDKGSFVSVQLQNALQLYGERLSNETISVRKNGNLPWNEHSTKYASHTFRKKKKDLLAFMHTISSGSNVNAIDLLEAAMKEIPKGKEKLQGSDVSVDSDIVMSLKETFSSFDSKKRTKETQQCFDAVAFASMAYTKSSNEKVRARLNLTNHAVANASVMVRSHRDAIARKIIPQYKHQERREHSNSHRNDGTKECIQSFCHSEYGPTRLDSNSTVPTKVGIDANGMAIYHPKRVWSGVLSNDEIYEEFLKSDEYKAWLAQQSSSKRMIGKTTFLEYVCKCVERPKQEDCVDTKEFDLEFARID